MPKTGSATGTVRQWDNVNGWGVIDSPATPGGCWTHYSVIDQDGYRSLRPGAEVEFDYEEPSQDGFAYRAVRVLTDHSPATRPPTQNGGAYQSTLTITWETGSTGNLPHRQER